MLSTASHRSTWRFASDTGCSYPFAPCFPVSLAAGGVYTHLPSNQSLTVRSVGLIIITSCIIVYNFNDHLYIFLRERHHYY
ncbi:hypothetical protein B0H19DRAFT_1089863 [Mycena capillaripes]|nr:hypothetical protein B0H19DRAFT_1089863 [Mycena capillaripes]